MVKRLATTALIAMAIIVMVLPVCASLVPMSWGFPTMVQNSSLTNLQSAFSNSNDFELSNISFPTTSSGVLDTAFPTITQIGNTSNIASQFAFQNQNDYSQFAYPWISIGGSPVPSMGLI